MKAKIMVLILTTFTVGLVELIIGGLMPMIAEDLHVSVSTAGQLITVYALVYAIAGPVLLAATARTGRKRLYMWSMLVFVVGTLTAFLAPTYSVLFLSRMITAASGSLIVTLSMTLAVKIVPKDYQARVIGLLSMGISSSIVLGVPMGVLLGNSFGWRILFLIIALVTVFAMIAVAFFLPEIPQEQSVPLRAQLKTLRNGKIMSAHLVTALTLAGHYTLYAYFTPFVETTMHLAPVWISAAYFVFGLSAVAGGMIGGIMADKMGTNRSIPLVIAVFIGTMFILPYSTQNFYLFTVVLVVWGILSWALTPAQQSYLIQNAPETSDIHQSFNFSALQLGIAVGSAFGGIVIQRADSYTANAWAGGFLIVLALLSAIYSLSRPVRVENPVTAD
ncbi:MFS transporter [Gorillibacterium massiliense]|uniref:MFS transporter n=1 Tax=Gorillibacterium massiliense TaxID=1280390 RepID=UPI0004B62C78|nr:MFS transporter [Gorillibacterium massiliense]